MDFLLNVRFADDVGAGDANRKSPRASDFIRLYDVILQNLTEVLGLPGHDGDLDLQGEIEVQKRAFQAFRCFYVAQAYVTEKKWKEGMALYDRVLENAKQAIKLSCASPSESSSGFNFVKVSKLEELIQTIAFSRYQVHSSAILEGLKDQEVKEKPSKSVPLCERLNEYQEDPNMSSLVPGKANAKAPPLTASFPPAFQPVPCKPLFFDLALNHVTFPSLEAKLGQRAGQQKAGISGFISNWWGWGGKK